MRILQITPAYKPAFVYGGPTVSVALLSEHLVKGGVEVRVLTTTANGPAELNVATGTEQQVDGVPVTYFKRITKDHTHFSPALLTHLWKSVRQYDVVHVHGWWNTVSMLSAFIATFRGKLVVISPRGMLSSYSFDNRNSGKKGMLHRFLGKPLLQKSFIHSTTQNEYNAIDKLVKTKGIFDIPNFVSFNSKEGQAEISDHEELQMVFFSRIEEKKGLDILLNALRYVKHPYHLTIAGDGEAAYVESLKSIALQNGISDKLSWVGFQTGNKFEYLSGFDLMVLPSHDENFGNVVVESLSVGTPVLLSENVGLSDYVFKNKLGWVCRLDDKLFSDAINTVSEQKDEIIRIRAAAPGKIKEDFNDAAILQRYIEMYETVIKASI